MKPSDASAATPFMTLLAILVERLFGGWVRQLTPTTLRADAMAGLLGAVLLLKQGIAFAMLTGLPPEYGLYIAIVSCIVAQASDLVGLAFELTTVALRQDISKAVALRSGQHIDANREFQGQGLSTIIGGFSPATSPAAR